jgi:hypothetical protein
MYAVLLALGEMIAFEVCRDGDGVGRFGLRLSAAAAS